MNDISLHIIDIIQNSISAGASLIKVILIENEYDNLLTVEIEDNGKGMDSSQVERVENPFFTSRTTRKVGMGVPLFKQSAIQSGGELLIFSTVGEGTTVKATFVLDHIDRPPLGDIANTLILMVSANVKLDFWFKYSFNNRSYVFDTKEIKEVLEGLPLNDPSVIKSLTNMVRLNIEDLKNGEEDYE